MSGMPKFHLRGHFFLTGGSGCDKIPSNFILSQTVDAEITAMMPLQRVWDAENQMRNKLSNGPRRVQSNVKFIFTEYSATCRHTSVAGDMFVSC